MNTTVSIEIAKVLKEMGFDEYTIAYYRQHTQNSYHLYHFKNKTGRSKGAKNSEIGKNHYQLTAPTTPKRLSHANRCNFNTVPC